MKRLQSKISAIIIGVALFIIAGTVVFPGAGKGNGPETDATPIAYASDLAQGAQGNNTDLTESEGDPISMSTFGILGAGVLVMILLRRKVY